MFNILLINNAHLISPLESVSWNVFLSFFYQDSILSMCCQTSPSPRYLGSGIDICLWDMLVFADILILPFHLPIILLELNYTNHPLSNFYQHHLWKQQIYNSVIVVIAQKSFPTTF